MLVSTVADANVEMDYWLRQVHLTGYRLRPVARGEVNRNRGANGPDISSIDAD